MTTTSTTPEPTVCGYSVACGAPATTTIDAGPLGIIATCQACADMYARLAR